MGDYVEHLLNNLETDRPRTLGNTALYDFPGNPPASIVGVVEKIHE